MKAIDFFCGGGGMTCGLRQAGINVIAGVDFDIDAKETYEANNIGAKFVYADVSKLEKDYFEREMDVHRNDDELILVGCSPCQFYSIIRSSKEKSKASKDLLLQFQRFIEYYNPGYVLVENVPGIITNKESVLPQFLEFLENHGYGAPNSRTCKFEVINMKDYGVPQNRRRFSLIATRLDREVRLPEKIQHPKTVREAIGDVHRFEPIEAGHRDDNKRRNHSAINMSPLNLERLSRTPHDGGSRLAWSKDKRLQLNCYKGKDKSFCDVYGRIHWDQPSPTITTKFLSISNGRFGHPEQNRGLSVREGAVLQSFPMTYVFKTESLGTAAKLIGNAVPPRYARKLGEILLDVHNQP
ncbi:MAG: DNA cytosine methyltransferase [Fibrobacter sp.]|nr:DNA cytosine methyltransferase [Fibrobacter sp.]